MATFLKQSTATEVGMGPFLDETDGKTAETALTLTQPDIRLKKEGGAWAQKNAAQTLTHEENGWYEVALDTTDTNTLGTLIVAIHESGALPVWREFVVLAANVYDSLIGASDNLQVDVSQFGNAAGTFASGRPEVNTSHIAGSAVSTSSAQIGVNVVNAGATAWGSGAITAASIAADAITAAKVADGTIDAATFAAGAINAAAIATDAITAAKIAADAIGASELAADAATEIATAVAAPTAATVAAAVWDLDATAHQTQGTFGQAIGDPVADTNTLYKAVVTDATGANVAVDVVANQADLANIKTRLPTSLVSGRIDASVGAMASGVVTAAAVATDAIDADAMADGAITAATFAAGAIDATAIAADAIGSSELAASAVTEIQTGLATSASISALNNISTAQVNAEVVDALNVDTYAEPGQASPAATATLVTKIGYLYKAWRNRHTQTSSEYALYADDGTTKDQKSSVSDNGTTFDRAEVATGP
jgi:hypothetical protein